MSMKTVRVDVSDLLLWTENPRVAASSDQEEALNNIYQSGSGSSQRTSRRQLMNLVESIAVNGYQNAIEPIIVIEAKERGKYIVQDANRRLSAIKLLRNPREYQGILEDKDYEKVLHLSKEYKDNVPEKLDVVVFPYSTEKDKEELQEVLARKHNGPMDGAGTVPWGTVAKDRFFKKRKEFTDYLEEPFEQQYGDNLTSYMGGSKSVTSTRRIFNSKLVKNYLDIKDPNDISQETVEKVKNLADEVKAYAKEHDLLLSRFKNDDIEAVLEPQRGQNLNENKLDYKRIISLNRKELLKRQVTKRDRVLGYKWLKPEYMTCDNPYFEEVDMFLLGLSEYGELKGDADKRLLKAYLLAPAIRSLFELSIQALQDEKCAELPFSVSTHHKENVGHVHEHCLNNNKFYEYLASNRLLFTTFAEAKAVIEGTDFAGMAARSNSTAHKSMKNIQMMDFIALFNDAVLFAILCEQYASFSKRDQTKDPAGQD